VLALAGVVAASLVTGGKFPALTAVVAALLVGGVCGSISGILIAKGRIPPFIATLGMMTAARGLALLYTNGRPIGDLSPSYEVIGGGWFLGLPIPILIFAVAGLLSHFLLGKSRFGKHVYAIGGNVQAARICGINVEKTLVYIYLYAGILVGLASVILSSRIGAGQPNAGMMYELDAIASTVIGGTSLSGGIGTIPHCIVGALIIGVLNNGLDLLNVSSYWQQVLKGIIIVSAVLIDVRKQKAQ
jgi:inositol transport system permease protein